ncbi:MAG: hypothetical protein K2Y23_19775 [Cyanobacteria bacterium]|nr:hypothetical protein [Cyanobacteriota bacterium]
MDPRTARPAVYIARVFVALACLALLGAWVTQLTGAPLFGMTQQHFFSESTVFALLGIALFADAFWHGRAL